MNNLPDTQNKEIESPESDQSDSSKDLEFIKKLIDKASQMLEDDSFVPRIQDALKAIQLREKVVKAVKEEEQKAFWDMIEEVRQEELPKMYPEENNLESQIKAAIYSLRFEVKNGVLPVKAITDAYNLGKPKESQLTYHRIGRLLSSMGFRKAKMHNNTRGILWDDSLLSPNLHSEVEKNEKSTSVSPPTPPSPPSPPQPVVTLPPPNVCGWPSS